MNDFEKEQITLAKARLHHAYTIGPFDGRVLVKDDEDRPVAGSCFEYVSNGVRGYDTVASHIAGSNFDRKEWELLLTFKDPSLIYEVMVSLSAAGAKHLYEILKSKFDPHKSYAPGLNEQSWEVKHATARDEDYYGQKGKHKKKR